MDPLDIAMIAALPILLILSGFFSGSETALFAMTETERMHLKTRTGKGAGLVSAAVESLLREPRMLLITVLLGNMIVNVSYFVISSVLLLRISPGPLSATLLAVGTLLGVILLGEVLPKMAANAHREGFASVIAPPLLAIHNVIAPLRILLDRLVVAPLARLTAPSSGAPPQLNQEELAALLELSSRRGDIDPEEQRILREVVNMSRLRVRDVMTPRVRMAAVPLRADRKEATTIVQASRRSALPVYERNLDTIVGTLDARSFLLGSDHQAKQAHKKQRGRSKSELRPYIHKPHFVPHLVSLDQLLEHFRKTRVRSAIVVDEFGGTAGIVTIEDVVERLVGAFDESESREILAPRLIGLNEWEVDGNMSVHDWADAFGQRVVSPQVATLGGLIIDRLGRAPDVGDRVGVQNIELEVLEVDRTRVVRAAVRLRGATDETKPEVDHDA